MHAGNRIHHRCHASPDTDAADNEEQWVSLDDEVVALLLDLSRRQLDVLELRYLHHGLENGEPQTLRKTGLRLSLTKERVRQIEEEAVYDLRQQCDSFERATHLVVDALKKLGGVARFDRLVNEMSKRVYARFVPLDGLVRLLLRVSPQAVRVAINAHGSWALVTCPISMVPDIQSLCDSVLAEAGTGLSPDDVVTGVCDRLRCHKVRRAFVAGVIGAHLGVDVSDEGRLFHLARPSESRLLQIMKILIEAGRPLHFRTITERLNDSEKRRSSPRAIHALLNRNVRFFVRTRRAVYGLRKLQDPVMKSVDLIKRVSTRVYWVG